MGKRFGFITIVIIFVASLIGFYFYLKKQAVTGVNPVNAVPVNSAMIIEIKNPVKFFSHLANKNTFYENLSRLKELDKLTKTLISVDSIIKHNDKLKQFFNNHSLTVSVHETGKKEFSSLYIIPVAGRFEANQLLKTIETLSQNKFTINTKRYEQVKIYHASNENKNVFYCYHGGLLMASKSEILLQDAVRQSESDVNLLKNKNLKRLMQTSGQHSQANIYLQFEYFQSWLTKILPEIFFKQHFIHQVGDWIELDLNLKKTTVLLNGFAFTDTDAHRFLNLFKGQKPQNTTYLKFIPAETESFWGFTFNDYLLYKQNLQKYMEEAGEADRYDINRKKIRDAFGKTAELQLQKIFANELVQVVLPDESTLFYIKTQGYRDGLELITGWLKNYCKITNTSFSSLKKTIKIDNETVFPVFKMPLDYFPTRLFGPWFRTSKATYVTIFDDYIIFGDTYSSLKRTVYNNILQRTLAYDAGFTTFADYLSNKVNFFGFVSLSGSGKILEKRLSKKAYSYYKNNKDLFKEFYAVGWQFSADNELYFNNFLFRYQPTNVIKAATEWETRLDTIIAFKPQLVVNHYTKDKEIFVQDMKNNVYLINNTGRILWKKQIEEPIMGEVFQVDYYKNGKFQYLFNTKSKLYLLDRNGNYVERYPITLTNKAVAPMSVFDYEKNKRYRLFVPLINNKVQVFNIEGNIVTGFKFKGTDNKIITPVQYVRNAGKDYIIITDKSRTYILNRKGVERVKMKKQFTPSVNNTYKYQHGSSSRKARLVRTSTDGTIYYVYFDGKVEEKKIREFSPNHYFNVEDVTGDRIKDFIFIDGREMYVYSITGKKIYTHKFSTEIKHSPAFYKFSSTKNYIGVTEAEARKIYLFDTKGKILHGFPLVGKTRFSIGFLKKTDSHFNLVVGGDEYYLYNYKLN